MELADKGLENMEVRGAVGGEEGVFCFGLGRREMDFIRLVREAPELSAIGFTPTCEDWHTIWGEEINVAFLEVDGVVSVIDRSNFDQCVFERGHDVTCGREGV